MVETALLTICITLWAEAIGFFIWWRYYEANPMTATSIFLTASISTLCIGTVAGILTLILHIKSRKLNLSKSSNKKIENTIRKWISVPTFTVQWLPPDPRLFFFQFVITCGDNRPVSIFRTREQPEQIALISAGTLAPAQRTDYESWSTAEKQDLLDKIRLEIVRLGVSYEGLDLPLEKIVLTQTISLDYLESGVYLRERIQFIRRAIILVQTVIGSHFRDKGNAKSQDNKA